MPLDCTASRVSQAASSLLQRERDRERETDREIERDRNTHNEIKKYIGSEGDRYGVREVEVEKERDN